MERFWFLFFVFVVIPYAAVELYCAWKSGALFEDGRLPFIVAGSFLCLLGVGFVIVLCAVVLYHTPILVGLFVLSLIVSYQYYFNKYFISWLVDDDEYVMLGCKFEPLIIVLGSLIMAPFVSMVK